MHVRSDVTEVPWMRDESCVTEVEASRVSEIFH